MNILIIGLGSIARKHIEALKILNVNALIYAFRSNQNAEDEEGIINIFNIFNLENFDFTVDFAIISNPSNLHYQAIEKLAKKNIPLFIEKPAVHSLDNIDNLIDLIDKKQIITYVACNLRFHPCLQFIKEKLSTESLRIDEVNIYCGSYLPNWRPGKDFRTIYSANALMGGGVHLDLFHEIDYSTWLFGYPKNSRSMMRNVSSLNIDAIDYANYILEYNDFTSSIILNYYRRKPKRELEIIFDNDTWSVDLIKNEIKDDAFTLLFSAPNFNVKDTYVLQMQYFIDCLRNDQQPMNSFKESVENLKICLKNE